MDRATKTAAVRLRLERAYDDLGIARVDLQADEWRGAVIRAYYAVFHITTALLLWEEQERVRHSGVQSTFGEVFIKTGRIEPEYGRIYTEARRLRETHEYEYEEEPITETDARRMVVDAERFVARMERYLREAGALDDTPKE